MEREQSTEAVVEYLTGKRARGTRLEKAVSEAAKSTVKLLSENIREMVDEAATAALDPHAENFNGEKILLQMSFPGDHMPGAIVVAVKDAAALVAVVLGCDPASLDIGPKHTMTPLETNCLQELSGKIFDTAKAQTEWNRWLLASPRSVSDEKLALFNGGQHGSFALRLSCLGISFPVAFHIPHSVLMSGSLPSQGASEPDSAPHNTQMRIPEVKLSVTGRLHVKAMTLDQVMQLQEGQIIRCTRSRHDPVIIQIDKEDVFLGEFGRQKNMNAVRIRGAIGAQTLKRDDQSQKQDQR